MPENTTSPTSVSSILTHARKARFNDLTNFSGEPSEDVERFLKGIKNIIKISNNANHAELLEIVRGKLTREAGNWFDDNETKFRTWQTFETEFRHRYLPTTITSKKFEQLKCRKQRTDELIINYCEEIIRLCQEIDPQMSDLTIIQHIQSGLNPKVRREISRRETAMNSLNEFLKYAKIEQDLYDTFAKLDDISIDPQQPQFDLSRLSNLNTVAAIDTRQYNGNNRNYKTTPPTNTQSSDRKRNSNTQGPHRQQVFPQLMVRTFSRRTWQQRQQPTTRPNTTNNSIACRVCNRQNHRTIDCYYRKAFGCFKCGEDHMIRDCKLVTTNFQ